MSTVWCSLAGTVLQYDSGILDAYNLLQSDNHAHLFMFTEHSDDRYSNYLANGTSQAFQGGMFSDPLSMFT